MCKRYIHFILIFISLFNYKYINAQLSKKHFIPPLTYAESGNSNPESQYFYISTPSNHNVNYTIKQIGSSDDITGTVSSTSSKEIFIASGNSQLFVDSRITSVVHNNKGFIIEADDVIYVSVRILGGGGAQAGALVSKGYSALGTSFRAGMFTNENPQPNYLNFISVMATEDNTQVTFDDLPAGILIKNYTGPIPVSNILLNEGESYILATNSADNTINRDALIGTLINSDKPIVVNTGSANGSFHNGAGRDYGIDQIVGADKVGSEYIFVKGNGNNNWENVLIVAHEDGTIINLNNLGVFRILNKGEYLLIEGREYNSNGNMHVLSNKPVFAYQGVGANESEANQGLFFVPPISCENKGKVDNIPNIESIGDVTFTGGVTIITNKGATVNINSQPIASFTTSGPFNVDGNTNYVTYKVTNLTGDISIDSSGELYCAYFNQNGAATSGSFYSGFPNAPEINFNTTVSSLGNCIPNVTLQAANTELFNSFRWELYNVTTNSWDKKSVLSNFKPSEPGTYRLIGIIDCNPTNLKTFESIEIPVSICPDDYDGDLIIDNLDVDIDNDGILNCDESFGNASINFADINNPKIIFQDNSTNNSTTTIYETENSNSFTGDNLGNFESKINPTFASKLKYELKFNQNINFKFTQNSSKNHIISDGEYFILKISPSSKNITLLDPDDQLLIDTNFDGEFESGITNISATEIWFKYKSDTSGAASTFEFVANQVNQIDFKHESIDIKSTSTFNGNLQLTCFSIDTDGDGIEDMFDLDSDNDGIPDISEAFSPQIALSNIDTDLDGLDDAFNGIITNIDTDNDGVPNYKDLDSDNDGIFDLVEAGHSEIDTNNDGILDNANTTNIGVNGLLNTLESTADSNILSYTITDTDTDGVFNFLELDADNDDCFDVLEAGFTDLNNDGFLDANPFSVDNNGAVINNTDGYTTPNSDYITSIPIELNIAFSDVIFCENNTNTITIDSTADFFQWEISTDGTTWNQITDNAIYDGSKTASLQITNTLLSYNNYKFRVVLNRTGNACPKTSNEITLSVNSKPALLNNIVQLLQCADNAAEITTVNLTEAEVNITNQTDVTFEYYKTEADAISGDTSKQVTDKESYPVNRTAIAWARIIYNNTSCYNTSKIEITASFTDDVSYDKTFEECDDLLDADGNNSDADGITNFNFSSAEQEVKDKFPAVIRGDIEVSFYETPEDRNATRNEILDIANHRNASYTFNQTIYIKIKNKNNNNCEGIGKLFLKTNLIPEFSVEGEAPNNPIIICIKDIPYTLDALNPADTYDYLWTEKSGITISPNNTQSIQISEGGEYTVTAFSRTTKACSRQRTIVVHKSNFETLDESFVTIIDDTFGTNSNLSIQIDIPTTPLINEEFQYALENDKGDLIRDFQDNNIFDNLEGGVYTILVKNKNGCGSSKLEVSVIQFPKFFTPNGDGENDTWIIKGASKTFYPNSSINIFNRYGKLVAQLEIDGQGWDGTYNGKILSSDDYWYNIILIPANNTKPTINKKGNFSLLRK